MPYFQVFSDFNVTNKFPERDRKIPICDHFILTYGHIYVILFPEVI